MRLRLQKNRAIILPTLFLVVVVLSVLCAALLSSSTSGLRVATHQAQADQALYAAEAGLAEAAEVYARTTSLPKDFGGSLSAISATYVVRCEENTGSSLKEVEGGPDIPPGTVYFISEGVSENGTRRRTGALFRLGMRAFQVGALAESMTADNASFDAYNSRLLGEDPHAMITNEARVLDAAVLASNSHEGQVFGFTNSNVQGGVYVGPDGDPELLIAETGTVDISNKASLNERIEVDPIEVPDLGGLPSIPILGNFSYINSPTEGTWALGQNGPSPGVSFTVDTNSRNYTTFSHVSPGAGNSIAHGTETTPAGPVKYVEIKRSNGNWVKIQDNGVMFHQDSGPVYEGYSEDLANGIFGGAVPGGSYGDVTNPDELLGGSYRTLRIQDGWTGTLESNQEYVVKDLIVESDGRLLLPPGATNVKIYVTGTLRLSGENAIINETRRAPHLQIMYTGEDPVELSGGARAYFILKAPEAEINLTGPREAQRTEFHGALVGKVVEVVNANFHFDTATAGIGTGTTGTGIQNIHRHRL